MLKALSEGKWERHGNYWILHDQQGRPVGILLPAYKLTKELGKDERAVASAV